jgi:pimeloyl-ACP methyl ester carboxylesterase
MSPLPPARPLYLTIEGIEDVFALLHMPAQGTRLDTAVLICPPFGWEETCSYRSRRDWAEHLAGAGHPTLRIDLPGTGDSGGSARDPGRLAAWTGAIGSAAGWLGATTDSRRVAAIGIGLGGVVTCHALGEGAPIDELVLWAVPSRGRTFVRELRTFGRMEAVQSSDWDEHAPEPPADGSIGVGGFALSAETTQALEALDLTAVTIPEGRLERALLLERDGIGVDKRLADHLSAAGATVSASPASGYGEMMAPPHEAHSPIGVFQLTSAWLAERSSPMTSASSLAEPNGQPARSSGSTDGERARPPRTASEHSSIELTIDGARISETPITIEQPCGRLFGVLSEPITSQALGVTALLMNAGAHRRIGQGRMWVTAARRWAARGVPTLRLDLEGIGDADGDATRFNEVGELYTAEMVDEAVGALDALDARNLGPAYVMGGLCSGAYWSFHAALRDERVTAAFLLNPQTLLWDPSLSTARVLRRGSRAKLIRGEVPLAQIAAVARGVPALAARRVLARMRTLGNRGDELDRAFDRLRDTGKHVQFIFSGPEPLREEFEKQGRLGRADRWPNMGCDFIPGHDHILRPLESQRLAHEALDRALERELRRVSDDGADAGRKGGAPERVAVNLFRSYG